MRRIPLFLVAGVIAGTLVLCRGATSSEPSQDSSEIGQLKDEIASLRQRVDALEQRLKDRPIVIPRGDGRQGPGQIDPLPWPRPVPKDWRPFDFNGMRFYMIPIDNSHIPASPPQK